MENEKIIGHRFSVGSAYHTEMAESAKTYLDVSLRAEKYIAGFAYETDEEIYWKKKGATWSQIEETEIDQSLYSGTAGILYYYLKLWEVTKENSYYLIVEKGARYLSRHWSDFFKQTPIFGMDVLNDGLYMGVGGIGLILAEIYRSTGLETAKKGLIEIVEYYRENVKEDADGYYWINSPAMAMDGGIILFLLTAYERLKDETIKKFILSASERFIKQGIETENGGLDFRGWPGPGTRPNYEFGSAGAGYLLTLLYDFTQDVKYLEAAKRCTIFLSEIKIPQKKGYLIPYDTQSEEPFYFLSSCHGCAGDAKLYYKLYEITGERSYLEEISAMVDGIESMGAPEKQSVGLWNTQCFCCGHAGLVQFFVSLYESLKDERYLQLARRTASVLLGEREDQQDGATKWSMAFWRLQPEFLTVDLGYYDGIAGIASVLLQMYLAESEHFQWKRLLDDPFSEEFCS